MTRVLIATCLAMSLLATDFAIAVQMRPGCLIILPTTLAGTIDDGICLGEVIAPPRITRTYSFVTAYRKRRGYPSAPRRRT
jgi:hypothetical protein